jgi:hypothetical protein
MVALRTIVGAIALSVAVIEASFAAEKIVLSCSGTPVSQRSHCSNRYDHGPAARHNRRVRCGGLYAHPMLLPTMPSDPAAANELAPQDLDGAYPGSTLRETALR